MIRAAAGAGLMIALLAAACAPPSPTDAASPDTDLRVRRGDLVDRFLLSGEVRAVDSVPLLTPRTSAWTLTILWLAAEGSAVSAGDPVVQFDSSSLTSQVEDRRLAALEAQKQLERREVELQSQRDQKDLQVWTKRIERNKAKLAADIPESLQSARDYQDKQLAYRRASIDLEKAEKELASFEIGAEADLEIQRIRVSTAQREYDSVAATLETLTLRAPVDGVVIHGTDFREGRKFQPGDTATAGMPVAELPDPARLEVQAVLSDVDEGRIVPGLDVRAILDTYPEMSFAGHVASITEYARESSRRSRRRAFIVMVELDEPDPALMRPGMSVKVEALRARWSDALIVPHTALSRDEEGGFVLHAEDGPRPVRVAGCDPLDCAVEDGPPEGTRLRIAR